MYISPFRESRSIWFKSSERVASNKDWLIVAWSIQGLNMSLLFERQCRSSNDDGRIVDEIEEEWNAE